MGNSEEVVLDEERDVRYLDSCLLAFHEALHHLSGWSLHHAVDDLIDLLRPGQRESLLRVGCVADDADRELRGRSGRLDFLAVAVASKYQQLAFGFEPSVAKKPSCANHQRRQVQQDFGYDVTSDLLKLDDGDVNDEQHERGEGGGDAPRRKMPGVFSGERVVQAKHMGTEARRRPTVTTAVSSATCRLLV